MLPGFAGHLISEAFLEDHLRDGPSANPDQAAGRARRRLAGWHHARASMGPTSSLRTMLAVGAEPLAAAFGFDSAADVSPVELIEWPRGRIAGYKLPKSVDFIDALPRNATGKILKRELRKPYWGTRERQVN